jgi:hypothetical protein
MHLLNSRHCVFVVSIACLAGCGRQERMEAVQFSKVLSDHQVNFAKANTIEKEFVSNARAWCDGITANGGGRGVELDQNATVATELAKSTVAVSEQLSEVRMAIDAQTLTSEYPRHVRNVLTTQLTQRQRMLQDMRAFLDQSAPQFLQFKNSRAYKGDSYPDGIGKLGALLRGYEAPADTVAGALTDLQKRYGLSGSGI